MFKRLFWFLLGTSAGAAGTIWVLVRARNLAARLRPTGLASGVESAVRQLGADLRAAALEGRIGMQEAEERLRAGLEPGKAVTRHR